MRFEVHGFEVEVVKFSIWGWGFMVQSPKLRVEVWGEKDWEQSQDPNEMTHKTPDQPPYTTHETPPPLWDRPSAPTPTQDHSKDPPIPPRTTHKRPPTDPLEPIIRPPPSP